MCVSVALFILHAKRMRRIILSSVVCVAVPYFFRMSQTARNSEEVIEYKMCVLILSTAFV